jgi:hypothetical protein
MMVNERVQIHKGTNSAGGIFIHEEFIEGTVVKVNTKSIRVHMVHVTCTTNGKITREYDVDETATFKFWKTVETEGKTVDIYKNSKYGVIKVAH